MSTAPACGHRESPMAPIRGQSTRPKQSSLGQGVRDLPHRLARVLPPPAAMLRSAIHAARPGALLRQALARGARPAVGAAAVSARRIASLAPTTPVSVGASAPTSAKQDAAAASAPTSPGQISQVSAIRSVIVGPLDGLMAWPGVLAGMVQMPRRP